MSQAIDPAPMAPGTGQFLQTLWTDPVPSFLVPPFVGSSRGLESRGLVPTDPPRLLSVPAVRGNDVAAPSAARSIPIRVYFSRHPDSESAFSAVFPVNRTSPDRAVARAALASLIAGPTATERAEGYYSELTGALMGPSSCSGRDFQIGITNGLATVRFCRALTSAGVGQDARMRAEIEATLRQFSTVRTVRLLRSSGHCLFDESGQDHCLGNASARTTPASAAPQSR